MVLEHEIILQIVKKYGLEIIILWWQKETPKNKQKIVINFPHGATPSDNSIGARIQMRLDAIERKLNEVPEIVDYDAIEVKEALITKGKMVKGETLRDYVDSLEVFNG